MNYFLVAALAVSFGSAAHAATITSGVTQVGDGGGIDLIGLGPSVAANDPAYSAEVTATPSDWVWADSPFTVDQVTYQFTFDLTGFDLPTISISGLWGVDNFGAIFLNGTEIAALPDIDRGNFDSLNAYGTSDTSLFNAGVNTVTYELSDFTNPVLPAAFRATIDVETNPVANVPTVPLPAGAPLLLGGLVLMGWVGRRTA